MTNQVIKYPHNGEHFLIVTLTNGCVIKVKPAGINGRDIEVLAQPYKCLSLNTVIRADWSNKFIALLAPFGDNYVTSGGIVIKDNPYKIANDGVLKQYTDQ